MPANSFKWLERIKSVEIEYLVAVLAVQRLLAAVRQDPSLLTRGLKSRDVRQTIENLEATYILRLFAEFEAGLRQFWRSDRRTQPPARTRDLLDGIAASCRIHPTELAAAHSAREYRNSLIHERTGAAPPLALGQVRRALCRFFAFLPPDW